jgi:uncharacterized protein (UPF0305 family)
MSNSQKLETLLKHEIIPDVESAIDELFEVIDKTKNASLEQKEELEELREMRAESLAILEDLARDEIEEDEVAQLLEELMALKTQA